jgi:hypothetical protein
MKVYDVLAHPHYKMILASHITALAGCCGVRAVR